MCIICQNEYIDDEILKILQCKHLFHPECLGTWLNKEKTCPVCKNEVDDEKNNI